MDDRDGTLAFLETANNLDGKGECVTETHPPMKGFNPRLGEMSREFGRVVTNETVRRQKRIAIMRPLRLSVRSAVIPRGPAGEESAIDVTLLDFSRKGIGFVSPRSMAPCERFTLTLRTDLGALTLFYGVRRSIQGHSSQWRVGGELLGTLGSASATRAEGIVWALMRGTCAGCGN